MFQPLQKLRPCRMPERLPPRHAPAAAGSRPPACRAAAQRQQRPPPRPPPGPAAAAGGLRSRPRRPALVPSRQLPSRCLAAGCPHPPRLRNQGMWQAARLGPSAWHLPEASLPAQQCLHSSLPRSPSNPTPSGRSHPCPPGPTPARPLEETRCCTSAAARPSRSTSSGAGWLSRGSARGAVPAAPAAPAVGAAPPCSSTSSSQLPGSSPTGHTHSPAACPPVPPGRRAGEAAPAPGSSNAESTSSSPLKAPGKRLAGRGELPPLPPLRGLSPGEAGWPDGRAPVHACAAGEAASAPWLSVPHKVTARWRPAQSARQAEARVRRAQQ